MNRFRQFRINVAARALLAVLALCALAACDQYKMGEAVSEDGAASYAKPSFEYYGSPSGGKAEDKARAPAPPGQFMAYEHSLFLEVKRERVRPVYEAALAACRDAAAEQCTVLDSSLNTGESPSATLRFRAAPPGIRKLLAALSEQGGVVRQSTTAEDLAQPIADNSKKLAMLLDYRTRLEALRGRAGARIESLIKVNKELSDVQSQIESLTGEKVRMLQRVQTEILGVDISSGRDRPIWRPIGRAFSEFGANVGHATGGAVTAVAYLLPWLPLLLGAGWLIRRLWRLRRNRAG